MMLCDRTRISDQRIFFLSFSQPLLTAVHHNMPSKAKNSTENASKKIPNIRWNNDGGALTWKLIAQLDKDENRHIFLGKAEKTDVRDFCLCYSCNILTYLKNTRPDSCAKVCKRIAEAILPEYAQIDAKGMGNRVKTKIESYVSLSEYIYALIIPQQPHKRVQGPGEEALCYWGGDNWG